MVKIEWNKGMKRLGWTVIAWLCVVLPLWAQRGMHVEKLFDGRFKHDKQCVELLVKGRSLKPYGLTLFRSLTFEKNAKVLPQVEALVGQDALKSVDKEVGIVDGRLSYGFYRFAPYKGKDGPLRYLVYRRTKKQTILIYMEGYTDIEKLKKMLGKQ